MTSHRCTATAVSTGRASQGRVKIAPTGGATGGVVKRQVTQFQKAMAEEEDEEDGGKVPSIPAASLTPPKKTQTYRGQINAHP